MNGSEIQGELSSSLRWIVVGSEQRSSSAIVANHCTKHTSVVKKWDIVFIFVMEFGDFFLSAHILLIFLLFDCY